MDNSHQIALFDRVYQSIAHLSNVNKGKFFGVDVVRAKGQMFVLVTPSGRLAIRALESPFMDELKAQPNAEVWQHHGKNMSQWVMLDDQFEPEQPEVQDWLNRAYQQASHIELSH